jgi:hypothetical protein
MRVLRMLVSGLVMAAMLCVGVEGSRLTLDGTPAFAKRHRHKRHHRRHRKHARRHGRKSSTPPV